MSHYVCIACGNEKEAEERSSCPVCGYPMFLAPYTRGTLLRDEILRFLNELQRSHLFLRDISFFRTKEGGGSVSKEEDLRQRFPDFETIRDYICSAEKTEVFCARVLDFADNFRKYISTPYTCRYRAVYASLLDEIPVQDSCLIAALDFFDISLSLKEINFPDANMEYFEIIDEEIRALVLPLLDDLLALVQKIRNFIRQNNLYGDTYKTDPRPSRKEILWDRIRMTKGSLVIHDILEKRYVVDLFSDGREELIEMLSALWEGIELLRSAPIFSPTPRFALSDGVPISEREFLWELDEELQRHYGWMDIPTAVSDALNGKTEDELFGLYNAMIELDRNGILVSDKGKLLKIGEAERQLNDLVGLSSIKESIQKIKAYVLSNKENPSLNLHMCFYGNPGTGKTEVARIIAGIFYENKILPTDKVVEVDRGGLVGRYLGETPEKTMEAVHRAMGGVLFIDEAYALIPKNDSGYDYGHEAVATLLKAMEDHRGEFCVIFAGYKNEMKHMISSNPGLRSRIAFELDFPDYSRDEMQQILDLMLKKKSYQAKEDVMSRMLDIVDVSRKSPNFANAREVRNVLDQVIMAQSLRCLGTNDRELGIVDVNKYIQDADLVIPVSGDGAENHVLTAEEELDQLIGLDSVKRMVKKIKAFAKRNKDAADFNLHMCFYGNPGTGKTEVARLLSRILYDAGVLKEAKTVETDSHGLIGRFVGETAPKTKEKIDSAMNGILFIDEAYGLVSRSNVDGNGYGDEAVQVLLKEMEDRRGKICVILAGYKNEMQEMIASNPGFSSRIQFTLEFPDYSSEELGQLATLFLAKKKYQITEDALALVVKIAEHYRSTPNFANARTVRNILDQVILNQNLRTEDSELQENLIVIDDVRDYLMDENISLDTPVSNHRIGFV